LISTWLVPISVSVIVIAASNRLWQYLSNRISNQLVIGVSLTLSLVFAATGIYKFIHDSNQKATNSEQGLITYVKEHKSPEDLYAIPLHMQDFRLETGAPAYVEFKSIPYQDIDVAEWFRRISLIGDFYRSPYQRYGCEHLANFKNQEMITHIVVPRGHEVKKCADWVEQYVDENYRIYRLEIK
jgi:hypothetical protein